MTFTAIDHGGRRSSRTASTTRAGARICSTLQGSFPTLKIVTCVTVSGRVYQDRNLDNVYTTGTGAFLNSDVPKAWTVKLYAKDVGAPTSSYALLKTTTSGDSSSADPASTRSPRCRPAATTGSASRPSALTRPASGRCRARPATPSAAPISSGGRRRRPRPTACRTLARMRRTRTSRSFPSWARSAPTRVPSTVGGYTVDRELELDEAGRVLRPGHVGRLAGTHELPLLADRPRARRTARPGRSTSSRPSRPTSASPISAASRLAPLRRRPAVPRRRPEADAVLQYRSAPGLGPRDRPACCPEPTRRASSRAARRSSPAARCTSCTGVHGLRRRPPGRLGHLGEALGEALGLVQRLAGCRFLGPARRQRSASARSACSSSYSRRWRRAITSRELDLLGRRPRSPVSCSAVARTRARCAASGDDSSPSVRSASARTSSARCAFAALA